MGTYRVAEICPNGHVTTDSADVYPEQREKYCSKCGEATITQCPTCNASIRGDYYVEGVFAVSEYHPPAYCFNCGSAFPWTDRKIKSALELLQISGELTEKELSQFKEDLNELTKDSPKVQVASLRFKKVMTRVGTNIASGVKEIIIDVLSEAAKKALWG